MPELPEIRAHAERLTQAYAGEVLVAFEPLAFTACKTATPDPAGALGRPLDGVRQRGKYLVLSLGDLAFVVHLMQGGRLRPDTGASARPRNGLARWRFADDRTLLLTEAGKERRAGIWVVAGDTDTSEPLTRLGPDADTLSLVELARIVRERRMRLHGLLRDQSMLAGIGRRLANEICHTARLSPFANTASLDDEAVDSLWDAIHVCIDTSLTFERARQDMSSSKDRPGAVHHRAGEPCPTCGDVVRTVTYNTYTVFYCATCQTNGKVLADNTTSRFLK